MSMYVQVIGQQVLPVRGGGGGVSNQYFQSHSVENNIIVGTPSYVRFLLLTHFQQKNLKRHQHRPLCSHVAYYILFYHTHPISHQPPPLSKTSLPKHIIRGILRGYETKFFQMFQARQDFNASSIILDNQRTACSTF